MVLLAQLLSDETQHVGDNESRGLRVGLFLASRPRQQAFGKRAGRALRGVDALA